MERRWDANTRAWAWVEVEPVTPAPAPKPKRQPKPKKESLSDLLNAWFAEPEVEEEVIADDRLAA